MELLAVALDDQPAVEHQVHATDACELHLQLNVKPSVRAMSRTMDSGPGLRSGVDESAEDAESRRQPGEQTGELSLRDQPLLTHCPSVTAARRGWHRYGVAQGIEGVHGGASPAPRQLRPVEDQAASVATVQPLLAVLWAPGVGCARGATARGDRGSRTRRPQAARSSDRQVSCPPIRTACANLSFSSAGRYLSRGIVDWRPCRRAA